MTCTATLTTLTHTSKVVATKEWASDDIYDVALFSADDIPDGVTVTRDGDRLLRDNVTLVTCNRKRPHHETLGHGPQHWHKPTEEEPYFAEWDDDTEGATPHVDPMDELVAVSEEAGLYDDPDPCPNCGGDGKEWFDGPTATWLKPCTTCGDSGTAPADGCDGTDCRIPAAHTAPPLNIDTACRQCGRPMIGLHICTGTAPTVTDYDEDVCPDCDGKTHIVIRGSATPCPSCSGSGTRPSDSLLRLTLDLLMCSDPTPLDAEDDKRLTELLDAKVRSMGYDGWVDAYHRMPNTGPDQCPDCGGTGAQMPCAKRDCHPCPSCGGSGEREFHAPDTKPPTWGKTKCPDCDGSEWVPCEHPKVPGGCHAQTHPCRSCGDSGTARAREENRDD